MPIIIFFFTFPFHYSRYDRRRHRKIHFDRSGKLKPKAVRLLSEYRPYVDPGDVSFQLMEEEEEAQQENPLFDIVQPEHITHPQVSVV